MDIIYTGCWQLVFITHNYDSGSDMPLSFDRYSIPANFFWVISVRFLSWECWDFCRRHDHFRRFPKKSEVFRRRPKSAEGEVIEKTLIHKIRDREEGVVIYSFYTWFSFLTWVWVNIFLEIVSSRMATTHIFQSGVRNWPAGVSRREIEVFNPQAWELAGIDTVVYWWIISVIIHCPVCLLISCKEPTANFRNQCNLQISYLLADCSDYITDMRDLIVDYQCNMSI